jgi:hypothetical protein
MSSDAFSAYYADLLQGTYDCPDRAVLNAFFPLGQTGGGLGAWWRYLRGHANDAPPQRQHVVVRSSIRGLLEIATE